MVFVGDRQLQNNAVNLRIGVCGNDFGFDVVRGCGVIIDNVNADIFAIFDFKVDIFSDDRIIGVANDKESGFGL